MTLRKVMNHLTDRPPSRPIRSVQLLCRQTRNGCSQALGRFRDLINEPVSLIHSARPCPLEPADRKTQIHGCPPPIIVVLDYKRFTVDSRAQKLYKVRRTFL